MKLFPHTLIRLGGHSFDHWAALNFNQTNETVGTIVTLKQKKEVLKSQLSETLLQFIQQLETPKTQNALQNIRRDIFNDRKLKKNKLNTVFTLVPEEIKNQIEAYVAINSRIDALQTGGEAIYTKELEEGRRLFKSLICDDALQKGLILSSRSLLDRLASYSQKEVRSFRKKEFQTEHSIIKYLSRMFAKTSPFSTFTNLSIGEFDQLEDQVFDISHYHEGKPVKGHIRLNNYLLKYLLDLFKSYRAAYLWFYLRPNPTVENKQDHFLYLTNNNNIEAFQRIPFNPVVALVLDTVKAQKQGVRFQQLVSTLMEQIDAEENELEGYIKQLIDFGLLEYHLGVSGIDPDWDLKLIDALTILVEKKVPHIDTLIATLVKIRKQGTAYAQADVPNRKRILSESFDDFRDICMKIHEAAGLPEEERKTPEEKRATWKKKQEEAKAQQQETAENKEKETENKEEEEVFTHQTSTDFNFKPEQIFYEDTTREVHARLDKDQVYGFVERFNELLQHLRLFKGMEDERIRMRHYFLKKYPKTAKVDLLTFYEDYFREFKKPEKEWEEKKKSAAREKVNHEKEQQQEEKPNDEEKNAFQIDALKQKEEKINQWNEAYKAAIKNTIANSNGEIRLTVDAIKTANEALDIKTPTAGPSNSYGCFVQLFQDEQTGKLKAMVNGSFAGYGKMMSRFLHIFDEKVTADLRSWNKKLAHQEVIFIEDCDASYFNANLHPPLMPYEIWMPGGHNTLPAEQQLPITDFVVQYDEEQNALSLFHAPSEKRAHVFDLGFQGHMGRSQLFQLLDKFTKAEYLFVHPVVNSINALTGNGEVKKNTTEGSEKKASQETKINTSPRIVFNDDIIVQRKSWYIPKTLIPVRAPGQTDWEYYLHLNLWRTTHQMPDEVFVLINPNRWHTDIDPELTKRLTRDDYKPQYIDFSNPFLVSLFEKIVVKVPATLKIQEMLPSSKQMLKIDGKRYVSEFVIQWYNEETP